MRILLLTQYFPPEVGAPQNRLFELAQRIHGEDVQIDVLTAMPNYPHMKIQESYRGKWRYKEEMGGLSVHRSWIFVPKGKGIAARLLNYFSFVWTSFWYAALRLPKYDVIFCESPPLFLGLSASLLCRIKTAKLQFNVSDLWPESAEKLGLVTNKLALGMATKLEEHLYKRSALISGQTMGIVRDIRRRFPDKSVFWLPNGVDLRRFDPGISPGQTRQDLGIQEDEIAFFYAGIIGHAQGLEIIVQLAAKMKDSKAKFILLGEGPVKADLMTLADKLELKNLFFLDAISKDEMPSFVSSMDVSIVPLRKLDLFKGAIPSKIFENLAMQKPIILGVDGEARELFIDEGNAGWFYEPENLISLLEKVLSILADPSLIVEKGRNGRVYVSEKFNRNRIAEEYKERLLKLELK